jgi:hypothetical protein
LKATDLLLNSYNAVYYVLEEEWKCPRIETQRVCTVLGILQGLDVIRFWLLEVISEQLLKFVKKYVPKQTPEFFF